MWTYLAWIKINWWDVNEKKTWIISPLYIYIYIILNCTSLTRICMCFFIKSIEKWWKPLPWPDLTTKRESTSYIIYNFFSRKKLKIHWHIEPLTIFSLYIHSIIVFRNFLHLQFKFSHHNLRFHLDKSNQLKPRWSFKTRSVFLQSI